MTELDLQRFCADDTDQRHYLRRPWSRDVYTYASNGCIIMRVPRIVGVRTNAKAPDPTKLMKQKPGEWFPVPKTRMPPEVTCELCEGSGREPYDKRYKCAECMGKKSNPDIKAHTTIGPAKFANRFLALIQGWQIAPPGKSDPAPIRNGEAEGLLMPMRI